MAADALSGLTADLAGRYYRLSDMTDKEQQQLIDVSACLPGHASGPQGPKKAAPADGPWASFSPSPGARQGPTSRPLPPPPTAAPTASVLPQRTLESSITLPPPCLAASPAGGRMR